MHKKNIALAAAMLLAGTATLPQPSLAQKDARTHRPANAANDRRGEDATSEKKQS